jgi:hypothetical protein
LIPRLAANHPKVDRADLAEVRAQSLEGLLDSGSYLARDDSISGRFHGWWRGLLAGHDGVEQAAQRGGQNNEAEDQPEPAVKESDR